MISLDGDGVTLSLDDLMAISSCGTRIASQLSDGWRTGVHLSRRKGRGMDFAEVRPYVTGDDIRNIDWKITARTGKPHTKLFREERDRSVYVLLDLSSDMYFGSKRQLKARMASMITAAVSWQALKNGDKVGGLILNNQLPKLQEALSYRKGVLKWLKQICDSYNQGLEQKPESLSLLPALNTLSKVLRPGAKLIIISDFYRLCNKSCLMIRHLRKKHDVNCIQIYDALERNIEGSGFIKAENQQALGYLTDDPEFISDYAKVASFRQFELEKKLNSLTRQLIGFDAAKPLTEQL